MATDGDFTLRFSMMCISLSLLMINVLAAQSEKLPEPQKYEFGPDSNPVAGVPEGTVTKHSWTSKVFEGTVRDYYVYVPRSMMPPNQRPSWFFRTDMHMSTKRVSIAFPSSSTI